MKRRLPAVVVYTGQFSHLAKAIMRAQNVPESIGILIKGGNPEVDAARARAIRDALAGATDAGAIKAAFATKAETDVEALIDAEWGDAVRWARLAMREDG